MPRYYFNVQNGGDFFDNEGLLLANNVQARAETVTALGQMLKDQGGDFWNGGGWRIRTLDEAKRAVCEISVTGTFANDDV